MFSNFDWDVNVRTLPYLFLDGMRQLSVAVRRDVPKL